MQTQAHRFTRRLAIETLEAREVPATTYDLGVARDFNAFIFEDMNASTSDVEGRVAVGGDASFYAYGIGDKLPNSHGTRDDLIVGEDLDFTYGQVFGGNIVYGSTADLVGVGIPNGTARQATGVVNFAAAESALTTMSNVLGAEAPNGSNRFSHSNLILRGIHPELNIFTVTADQLAETKSISVFVRRGSTAVINVYGDAVSIQNLGLRLRGVDCSNVLWNFPEADALTISGVGLRGSLLAPTAHLDFNNGQIQGTVITNSMTGNGQFNLCTSDVRVVIPDPATLQGTVFLDANADNQRGDPNVEVGLDGIEVVLTGLDSLWRRVNRSALTQSDGEFNFGPLWPGIYSVRVIPPQKYESSALQGIPGTVEGNPSGLGVTNRVRFIMLGEGQDGIDYLLPLEPSPD
jgi:choice-of-anchor A domain-containing protein